MADRSLSPPAAIGRELPIVKGCYRPRLCENACAVLKSALLRKICQRLFASAGRKIV